MSDSIGDKQIIMRIVIKMGQTEPRLALIRIIKINTLNKKNDYHFLEYLHHIDFEVLLSEHLGEIWLFELVVLAH